MERYELTVGDLRALRRKACQAKEDALDRLSESDFVPSEGQRNLHAVAAERWQRTEAVLTSFLDTLSSGGTLDLQRRVVLVPDEVAS